MTVIVAFFLMFVCLISSSSSQPRFGRPRGCLLNRLDVINCTIVNTARTNVPQPNQYAIYTTRIRGNRNSRTCVIRSRDDIVRPLDTIGGDPRVYYLFSPGRSLANPINYGNQLLMKYRVQCPDNHFAFFNLTSLEIEEPICEDRNFPQPRCTDSLQVSRGGGGFGFIETCGTNIPSELASSLDSGTIEVILRTSDRGRFPGFEATVVCVSTDLLAMTGNGNSGGQSSNPRQFINARVRRQVEYVKRMKRSTLSLEDATTLACSVDEVNVPFNGGITYVNRVVTILDMMNMAVIRRLPSPINKLVVMDTNGTQLEFIRDAPLTNDSVTIFNGPGPLTRAGVLVFFTSFTTIPELGNTPPEAVIPATREADVTSILLAAHSRLALEGNGEALTLDELEPPPIDLDGLGIEGDDIGDNVTTGNPRFARHTLERSHRIRRFTENIQPVQCDYTNNAIGLAVLNQMSNNPVLITIIDVIFNCTEREQPGRIQEIIESVAIDFQFTQDEYLVREDVGNVTVCLEIATEGFLPRDVVVSLVTVDGNATEPEDYSFVNTTSMFFNATAQGGPGSLMCIQIEVFNDNLIEFDEMFIVTADSPDPNVNTTFIMATVIILDEDVMFQITNSPGSFTVTETASTLAESIVVSLLVGTLPFPVEIVLNDIGTAKISDGDFTASLILTFDTGSGPGISSSAQVTILRDLLVEEENETLILQLTTMPLARLAFPVGEDLVEGTIMDVDVPVFLLTETNFTVDENDTIVQLSVELVQSTLTFPIHVLVQDGTQMANLLGIFVPVNRLATIGEDYLSFGTTLTFEAGSGPGTKFFVNVSILQDVPIEIDEVIIVVASILSTRGEFSSGGDTDVTTITIIDNEAETVVCPELSEPENGTITYSINQPPPFPLGTEAKYTCNLGLGLERGDVLRVCLGDVVNTVGQWNGAEPHCNAIRCPALEAPDNGIVEYSIREVLIDTFSFGAEANFSCSFGFALIGEPVSVCVGNGSSSMGVFDTEAPVCKPITCETLPAPENGTVSYSTDSNIMDTFSFETEAYFSCDVGFSLVGSETRTCGDGTMTVGEFNGTTPACEAITCETLPAPENGTVSYSTNNNTMGTFSFGTEAYFSCDVGFSPVGSETRSCGDGNMTVGEFNGTASACEAITCETLPAPENGMVSYSTNNNATGTFSFGTEAYFSCDVGFFLIGDKTIRTCVGGNMTVGKFNGTTPACEAITCETLPATENGTVSYSTNNNTMGTFSFGTEAYFSCDVGFSLVGSETRSCGDGNMTVGEFNGTAPACEAITCETLPAPENGMVSYSTNNNATGTFSFGTEAYFSCDVGFFLIGDETIRTCVGGNMTVGKFNGTTPACEAITCETLPAPENGMVSYSTNNNTMGTFSFGTEAYFSCDVGFSPVGSETRSCGDGNMTVGEFNGTASACEAITCETLPAPENGMVSYSTNNNATGTFSFGTEAYFSCDVGFFLIGDKRIRTCVGGNMTVGKFNGTTPACEAITCETLPATENGTVSYSTNNNTMGTFSFGTEAYFSCDVGFSLVGSETRSCGDGNMTVGEFNGTAPACEAITCETLPAPENGMVSYSTNNNATSTFSFGTEAYFSCDVGFFLIGDETIRTCVGGNMTVGKFNGTTPACEAITCETLPAPENGMVSYSTNNNTMGTFSFGTEAYFSCDVGFSPVGSETRSCGDGNMTVGEFNGTAPACEAITCETLPAPENGMVSYSTNNNATGTFSFGTEAYFSCDVGFFLILIGDETIRTCVGGNMTVGKFNGTTPACEAITCETLPAPENGMVSYSTNNNTMGTFSFGTEAYFSCDVEFSLVGSETRSCGDGNMTVGEFNGTAPACEAITCETLPAPENGMVSYSTNNNATGTFSFGTEAYFSCDVGFFLIGDETIRTCVDGNMTVGKFNGTTPACEAITCETLPAPENGTVSYSTNNNTMGTFSFGIEAYFSCDVGFSLVGSETRSCGDGNMTVGEFNGTAPACEAITCETLPAPENGMVSYSTNNNATGTFSFGTEAYFSCDAGFFLIGDETIRTCVGGNMTVGKFNGTSPACEAITCETLPAPENGMVSYSTNNNTMGTFSFGTEAYFSCDVGFSLVGSETRSCGDGNMTVREFNGTAPACEAITCETLPAPENGMVSYSTNNNATGTFSFGTEAYFSCDVGFFLIGDETIRTCVDGNMTMGKFNGTTPACEAITCETLPAPENGMVSYSTNNNTMGTFSFGTEAYFSCDVGFSLVGSETRSCGDGNMTVGEFNGTAPTCEAITCETLPAPENGMVSYSTNNNATGTFSFGTEAYFSCDVGFFLIGDETIRTCVGGNMTVGKFNGTSPACEAITCETLPAPENGMVSYSTNNNTMGTFSFGTEAYFSCDVGFSLVGSETRSCGDGNMTVREFNGTAPACEAITCETLPAPENGMVSYSTNNNATGTFSFGTEAYFSCDVGFFLIGDETIRTCVDGNMTMGKFNGTTPACEAITCETLPAPENGMVSYSTNNNTMGTFSFGTEAYFSCDVGFSLVGSETRSCGDGNMTVGEFNGTAPTCEAITCETLPAPENGMVSYSTNNNATGTFSFGTEAYFSCDVGFFLIGDETIRTCVDGNMTVGKFNGTSPACEAITCETLPVPENGTVSYSTNNNTMGTFSFGTEAYFSCDVGFSLIGSETRSCGDGNMTVGEFNGTAPACT
ncbi:complement receptor type 1-like isoform X3 [Halichondria panicea]|uniref:complement receptor type 1-like isoform X3 n=1 Tax=Halichondria panicea TaxID=6063 RepID=UPI00312B8713